MHTKAVSPSQCPVLTGVREAPVALCQCVRSVSACALRARGAAVLPGAASLQCDLVLVHMLTAGSPGPAMICQPLFAKARRSKPVR